MSTTPKDRADLVALMARAICKSGRLETGQGTCAAICMSQLGSARRSCAYVTQVHGAIADIALDTLEFAGVAVVPKEATDAMLARLHSAVETKVGGYLSLPFAIPAWSEAIAASPFRRKE